METVNSLCLLIHIFSGYTAFTTGLIVVLAKKGNKSHRLTGRIFFYSMLGASFSAIYLSIAKNIPFLLFIGIFVFYQNYAGFRSIKSKDLSPNLLDILVLLIALLNGVFMIISLNVVLVVFGLISLFLVATDLKIYYQLFKKKDLKKLTWLGRHLGMMMGSFIGAITAFLVVNVKIGGPFWLIWLAPTIVFVPLMRYWTWRYTKKSLKN